MKITLLKVRKNMIRRLNPESGILAAGAVARVRSGLNSQVWAFFDHDLPGQARWHLWNPSAQQWITGDHLKEGPLGSENSLFEYPR